MNNKVIFLSLCIVGLSYSSFTHAVPPHYPDLTKGGNRWTITAYDDTSAVHQQWATQGICFYYTGTRGTHQQYYWVSDTFPDWNGRATQEGDQVFMHGDYARDVGHDGMQWQLTTMSYKDEGFGHWHEWREDGRYGRTIGFANAKLKRVGSCRWISLDEAVSATKELELKANERGELMVTPYGLSERDLEEIK